MAANSGVQAAGGETTLDMQFSDNGLAQANDARDLGKHAKLRHFRHFGVKVERSTAVWTSTKSDTCMDKHHCDNL